MESLDLRKYATKQNNEWAKAGSVKRNKHGKIGMGVSVELYMNMDEEGNLIIPIGNNIVRLAPEVNDKETAASYKFGGTVLTVSTKHIANVLNGAEGAFAIVNAPPSFKRANPQDSSVD